MIWVVTQSVLRIPVTVRVLQPEAGPVFSVFPSQTEFSGQPHLPSLLPPLAAAFPGFKIDMHKGEGNTYEEDIRLPTQDIDWLESSVNVANALFLDFFSLFDSFPGCLSLNNVGPKII